MHKVNQLVIVKENFETQEEYENSIKDAIMLLLNNNYIMTVRYDANEKDLGIVVIEYNHAEKEWGSEYPYWLKPDEIDQIEMTSEDNVKEGY